MTTLAFTGTRKGLTSHQLYTLNDAIIISNDERSIFLHGGAVGADTQADDIAALLAGYPTEVYPCSNDRYLYWVQRNDGIPRSIHAIRPPLVRNRIMVDRADHLIACPYEPDEQPRGGTWSTWRYAKKIGKSWTLILPDGTVEHYNARSYPA